MVINNIFIARDEEVSRIIEENEHPLRGKFERDRDRIMYSKPFRRLSGKTQIFLTTKDDHTRTRLTHTLEVAQIARTIARTVGLNEILAESIALGHDMGHTPFGHVGERMLDKIMRGCYPIREFNRIEEISGNEGFKHNWQGIRVAAKLDPSLNLTKYTLWGILNHSSLKYKQCSMKNEPINGEKALCLFRHEDEKECKQTNEQDLEFYKNMMIYDDSRKYNIYNEIKDSWTFEGYIVAIADEIAQRHHDIEDALEYNLINQHDLLKHIGQILQINDGLKNYKNQEQVKDNELWCTSIEESIDNFKKINENEDKDIFEGRLSKFIVNHLTSDVIYNLRYILDEIKVNFNLNEKDTFNSINFKIHDKVEKIFADTGFFSEVMKKNDKKIQTFLSSRILNSQEAQKMDGVGQYILRETFKAYLINPQLLPDKTVIKLFKNYYQNLYKDNWKIQLDKDGLTLGNNINVGAMRNKINDLHYNKINIKYKNALLRTVCDYIAGMTDKYIIDRHRELYNISY